MRHRVGISAVLVALAVAGCSGVRVSQPVEDQLYSEGDLEFAAQSGELRTAVSGNPFGGPQQTFAARVMGMMKGANRGPVFTYTSTPTRIPPDTHESRLHVSVVFNPPINLSAGEACAAPGSAPTVPPGDRVRMLAAFCFGGKLLSQASGSAGGIQSADDPKFRELVRGVTLALFPDERRDLMRRCLGLFC